MADPPAGVQRLNGDSIQPNMAACAITTALIAVAIVGLRLYTRFFLTAARFQIDDAFVCCAAVCSIMLIPISYESLSAHYCMVSRLRTDTVEYSHASWCRSAHVGRHYGAV